MHAFPTGMYFDNRGLPPPSPDHVQGSLEVTAVKLRANKSEANFLAPPMIVQELLGTALPTRYVAIRSDAGRFGQEEAGELLQNGLLIGFSVKEIQHLVLDGIESDILINLLRIAILAGALF